MNLNQIQKSKKSKLLNDGLVKRRQTERVSPVDSALLFGHYSLEVSELQEAVMEVVHVENTHQQEGCGNENPGEQHGDSKLLQAQILQAAQVENERKQKNMSIQLTSFLRYP